MKQFSVLSLAALMLLGAGSSEAVKRHQSLFRSKAQTRTEAPRPAVSPLTRNHSLPTAPAAQSFRATLDRLAGVRPQKRVTAGGTNLFGYLFYSDDYDLDPGIYSVSADPQVIFEDPAFRRFEIPMDNGWYIDGKVAAYSLDIEYDASFGFFPVAFYYFEVDFETGTLLTAKELDIDDGYMQISAYDSHNKKICGYGYDWMDNFGWLEAPASNPKEIELVRKVTEGKDICYSMTYNPMDGLFYGVTTDNRFVSITPEGEQTLIAKLDSELYDNSLMCGLAYSPSEELFYWNPQFSNTSSGLVTISLEGEVNLVEEFVNWEQYTYLFTTDEAISPTTPKTPEVLSYDFPQGALSGSVSFRLPSETGNGTPISGELNWFATLDDIQVAQGTAAPGAEVSVDYADVPTGSHSFGLFVKYGEITSLTGVANIYVGLDTPATPTNVALSLTSISWSPVEIGAHGGYVDPATLSYKVYLNEELIGETSETSFPIDLMEKDFNLFQASVIAVAGDLVSEPGLSNTLLDGHPLSLPLSFQPTPEQYGLMTNVDANGDRRGWSYNNYYNCLVTTFSKGEPMDDWIFLPAVEFDSTSRYYTFGMTVRNLGIDWKDEYIEVVACKGAPDPEAEQAVVMSKMKVDKERSPEVQFRLPETGVWYVGLHCVSAADQYGILASNIYLRDQQISDNSPAAVSDLSATAFAEGELKANVTFTLPTLDYKGNELDKDLTLTALVQGTSETSVEGKPGETLTAAVETEQGENTISVFAFIGNEGSPAATCQVYTGQDVPTRIMKMTLDVAPDMLSAELYWEAPTEGVNGGYIDPAQIRYEVYRYVQTAYGNGWSKLEDVENRLSYTFRIDDGAPMQTVTLGVLAINVAGHSGDITYRENLLGAPYQLPITEDFEEPEELTYNPWLIFDASEGVSYGWASLDLLAPEVFPGDTQSALWGRTRRDSSFGRIGFPRFSTMGKSAAYVILESYAGQYAADTYLLAQTHYMEEPITLGRLPRNEGPDFQKSLWQLPEELLGKEWVQLYLESTFETTDEMMLTTFVDIQEGESGLKENSAIFSAVRGEKGAILLKGLAGERVTVTNASGATVAALRPATAAQRVPMAPGLYVVRANALTAKVLVR